jgi:beta-phosphoglucomutase family hydrolase
MITTIIFDLDGLLSDTETLHMHAHQEVWRSHGIDISDNLYAEHWIRKGKGIKEFISNHKLNLVESTIRNEKGVVFNKLLKTSLKAMPGAKELLNKIHKGKRLAVASSSYRSNVEQVLSLLDFTDYFEIIVAGEDVKEVKPAPDIFLYTASHMNVNPSECIVIEDAEKGIRAASAAGMKSVAVPNEYTKNNDFSQATFVVASLLDVEKVIIEKIL